MLKLTLFLSLVTCALVGCLPPQPLELGPAVDAGPVTCDTGCKVAWQRSQFWIAKHSLMKIQTATDVLVQTYNPTKATDQTYGFTVTREPMGGEKYRITLETSCANQYNGCSPIADDVKAAFYYYVATGVDVLADKTDLVGIQQL